MKRYLLDTCALKWYWDNDERIKPIAEDIEYYRGDFAVSMESLKEMAYLSQFKGMRFDVDFNQLIKALEKLNIAIIEFGMDSLNALLSLPAHKNHTDPTDRHIIATAIAKKRILVSGDAKFRSYTEHGLSFLEI